MNASDLQSFASAVQSTTYQLEVVAPVNGQRALQAVVADIEGLLALNEPEMLARRCEHFKIPGTNKDSYREKVFELGSSRRILAGIRHAGGNRDLPFVNVIQDFNLTERDIPEIMNLLKKEFSAFSPKHLAIWMKPEFENSNLTKGFSVARRYLAGRIKNLDLSLSDLNSIELRTIVNEDYFDWYKQEYQTFHRTNPDLESWVPVSQKKDLEKYRNQGLLQGAYKSDQLIGIIGGEKLELLGLPGLYIGELLISQKFKGRGYAAEMQRQLIAQVSDSFEVVWGTIDARNIPSTRTALRVGRRPMRTEFFAKLD